LSAGLKSCIYSVYFFINCSSLNCLSDRIKNINLTDKYINLFILFEQKKIILSSVSLGICGHLGQFDKGEVVSVRDEQLNLIGVGVSKCSSEDLKQKKYGRVFIRKNDFLRLVEYPFVDLDMMNIKQTLTKLRKKLHDSDDDKFIIAPLSGDIDRSEISIEDELTIIDRSEVKDLTGLFRHAKQQFSLTFDEWLIYSSLEGSYEKYE